MIDLAKIKAAARRAPEGDYTVERRDDEHGDIDYVVENDDGEIAICYEHDFDAQRAKYSAEWFALASPATVLELVAEIERLRSMPQNVRALVEEIERLRAIDGMRRAEGERS